MMSSRARLSCLLIASCLFLALLSTPSMNMAQAITPTPAITPLWENTQNLPQGGYIDWHPDGSMLAVATNSTVKIVSTTTGQTLNTLPNFVDKVYTVDWNPDGTKLAIAVGTEVQIWNNVWNGSTASILVNFQGHHIDRVGSIAWDNTGNRIISASADKALIWNSQTAQIQQTLIQTPGPMGNAIWSPNDDTVATSGFDSQVTFWNPSNGQIVGGFSVLYGSGVTLVSAISWKPDGSQIATASEEGIIRIWDVTQSSPFELVALYGHTKVVLSLAWKPNSDLLASSSMDGTIRIWNTANTEQLQITEIDLLTSVTWKPDGSTLVYIDADGILQNIFTPVFTPTATPN